jgi:hypothetical protein
LGDGNTASFEARNVPGPAGFARFFVPGFAVAAAGREKGLELGGFLGVRPRGFAVF